MGRQKIFKRFNSFLLLGIWAFLLPACDKENNSRETKSDDDQPIVNASFEEKVTIGEANPVWKNYSWKPDKAKIEWLQGEGNNGSNCISLSSTIDNDIALMQDIQLEGDEVYQLTAKVKTKNVTGGHGANICLFGTWQSSEPLTGTNDWQQASLVFLTPDSGKVTIACRLGFWGATSSGKVWFDDIRIQQIDMFDRKSEHLRLRLKQEDASVVASSTITSWLNNLDKAYEKYYELIGEYPYNGNIITIFSVDSYPGGWAVAGNPILWYRPYIQSSLMDIENKGDWSFGILHEIGHDFAPGIGIEGNSNWNWNEEMFANFRMYYAVELLDASVIQDKLYTGSELKNYYRTYAGGSYENKIRKGDAEDAHDGIMYTLIRIKDQIGWEPFKQTFRFLYQSDAEFTNNTQRFNHFLDKLSEFSGEDVRQTYPEGELEIIEEALKNE